MIQALHDGFYLKVERGSRALALAVFSLGGSLLVSLRSEESTQLAPVDVTASQLGNMVATTPAAITAYDGDFLKANGITDFQDLAPLVPGLFVSAQAPDSASLNLRGLTSDTSDPRVQPRVSVFQDGVPINNAHGNNVALFDEDNVAVFKGPQPTQFGEGVQSGALSLTSNRAVNGNSGALTVGGGNFDAYNAEGFVNRPLIENELFARVAVFVNQRDGYIKNTADGSDLQGEGTVAFRTSLRWEPTNETTADLILSYQHDDTPGIDFKSAVIAPPGGDTNPYTAADLTRGSALGVMRTIAGLTGIVRHDFNDAWTLTSTSAWRQVNSRDEFDADGSSLYLLELGERFQGRQLSQELRFAYDEGGPLTASLGMNVARETGEQTTIIRTDENTLYQFLAGTPFPVALNHRYSEQNTNHAETTSGDLFGRADYKLSDKLTLGAGLRVTQEQIISRYHSFAASTPGNLVGLVPSSGGVNDIFQNTNGQLTNSADVQSWEGQVDARYAFNRQLTAYATVSRGRRPPVLDFDAITLAPFRHAEETVWNYEAGVKGATANSRIRYDASVFQYYFDHFQTERVIAPGVTQSFDGGRARGQGFEATVQGDVARELTLFATYGFTDAKFAALDDDGQPQAYAGDTFRLTARNTLSLGGTLSLSFSDGGTVFFTPIYSYRSACYFEDNNAQNQGTLRQGGFALVNLRFGYHPRSQRWEILGYVDNVFGKDYLLDSGNIGGSYGIPTNVPAAPRTFGAQATVRF